MSDRAPTDLDQWIAEIHDPAEKASEGQRVLRVKDGEASYEVAPLPDGRFAVRVACAFLCGDNHSMRVPWRAYPSREACLAFFLEQARRHFALKGYRVTSAQAKARKAMQAVLSRLLPSAEPVPEAAPPKPPKPVEGTERNPAEEKPPVQGLLF